MSKSPSLNQYINLKKQHKDCVLFFRLGGFFELYYEDAEIGEKVLHLTLGKKPVSNQLIPVTGVPADNINDYIPKLVQAGYKVALCDQLEKTSTSESKTSSILKREVVKIFTPGTIVDSDYLDGTKNNYLMSIYYLNGELSVSIVDTSIGEFLCSPENISISDVFDEVSKFTPAEIICNEIFFQTDTCTDIKNNFSILINSYNSEAFELKNAYDNLCKQFSQELVETKLGNKSLAICSAGAIIAYLLENQKSILKNISNFKLYNRNSNMLLDSTTRKNLELIESSQDKTKKGSLLAVLDKTKTALGARLLRKWINEPILNIRKIKSRLDSVEELKNNKDILDKLIKLLKYIEDIERLPLRIHSSVKISDLLKLKKSLEKLPEIYELISSCESYYINKIYKEFDVHEDLYVKLDSALVDSIQDDSSQDITKQLIKTGYSPILDKARNQKNNSSTLLDELQKKERETTNIKNLKIIYVKSQNRYYIEIKKSKRKFQLPKSYTKVDENKLVERYTTPELVDLENKLISSSGQIDEMEAEVIKCLREEIINKTDTLKEVSNLIAILDVFQSLAVVAEENHYTKPDISTDGVINICNGRHPVVEKTLETFVPNDCYLDIKNDRIHIITGSNMAGKSTYMRQVALIVLMTQIGSFVPAKSASICPINRIYTRIGASDNLAAGKSTFMVEISEVANILNTSDNNCLMLFDEVGRGTSTFDGLSIAKAILIYLSCRLKSTKVLFSTHYHELAELEGKYEGIVNYLVEVKKENDNLVFKRKVKKGFATNSYGIEIANLAGLPKEVIKDARDILKQLEKGGTNKTHNINIETLELLKADLAKNLELIDGLINN